ncbi:MAG: methyltransferase domain-containing protein [Gemmatimonadetes bacterium]|nr:methyltransferase domain-containing protein [Gemmatimonadota bacterium]
MTDSGFKTGEDASRYDQVSAGVDEHSHLLRPLVQRMVSFAALKPGERLLDVGCGTGIIANQGARRVGPKGKVVGIDISEGMLVRARAEAARRGVDGWVDYQVGDAEALQFADASFDCVTCLFTFMHLPQPERAIGDMYRVLSPRGRAIVGVGSRAPWNLWRGWMHRALRVVDKIDEKRGKVLTVPDLLNSLVRTHFHVSDAHGVVPARWTNPVQATGDLIAKAGFSKLKYDWEASVASFVDPEEFWDVQNTYSSFARQRLIEAPPEKVAQIRAEFLEKCETVISRGGRLIYPIGAVFVSGSKA